MEIGIIKHSGNYKVQFSHENQCFILSIDNDNIEEAEWVKRQLANCFNKAFGWSEDKSALPIDTVANSALNEIRDICNNTSELNLEFTTQEARDCDDALSKILIICDETLP